MHRERKADQLQFEQVKHQVVGRYVYIHVSQRSRSYGLDHEIINQTI